MRVFRPVAAASFLLVASCLLAGCGAVAAVPADDAKLWQGTWRMDSYVWNGAEQKVDMQWVVDGGHYDIRLNGQLQNGTDTFTLDPGHKRLDVFYHAAPGVNVGGHAKGIYEIHGDSLRLCYDLAGRDYPKVFDAPANSWRVVFVLHRDGR